MNYWKPYENIIKKKLNIIGNAQQHGTQIFIYLRLLIFKMICEINMMTHGSHESPNKGKLF
jgi:low temperature requirement protein LtrA